MKFLYELFLTVSGVALFALLDKASGKVMIASCICGALTFTVSEFLYPIVGNGFINYFFSASVTCVFSEIGARVMRVPATVIMLAAIIPLVPGALMYRTVRALIERDASGYKIYGSEALWAVTGIAVAIAAISAAVRLLHSFGEYINKGRRNKTKKEPM